MKFASFLFTFFLLLSYTTRGFSFSIFGSSENSTWVKVLPVQGGPQPRPRTRHSAVVIGDDLMVVFGGQLQLDGGYTDELWAVSLTQRQQELQWVPLCVTPAGCKGTSPAYPRSAHAATVVMETSTATTATMFVMGGYSDLDGYMSDLWALKLTTNANTNTNTKTLLDLPPPEWVLLCSSLSYVLWGTCGQPPAGRAGHHLVAIGTATTTTLVLFGGENKDGMLNDAWAIDVAGKSESTMKWKLLCSSHGKECGHLAPEPRAYHTSVVVHNSGAGGDGDTFSMVVFGGQGGGSHIASTATPTPAPGHDVWILTFSGGGGTNPTWQPLCPSQGCTWDPVRRWSHTSTLLSGIEPWVMVVVGGQFPSSSSSSKVAEGNDVWALASSQKS